MKKIAIVYDRVNKFGGAERVLEVLREAFPESILYTSVYDKSNTPWIGDWEVRTSFLQHVPFAKKHHEWFGWLMPLAFESLDLSDFDVIISVTSEAAKGVLTRPDQLHICYCLTPTRYLWSHTTEYGKGRLGFLKRLIFSSLREWDYIAARKPDRMIAISAHIAKRIQKYYQRSADAILYPPSTQFHINSNERLENHQEYFLVVSRLVAYKKIDIAIQACLAAQKKLVIVGVGSDEQRLRQICTGSDLITFAGFVSEDDLNTYYCKATALLCPQEEDFGLVSIEAQQRGVPVISYSNSGMSETILPGKTGLLVADLEISSWQKAIEESERIQWKSVLLTENTLRFEKKAFVQRFKELLEMG